MNQKAKKVILGAVVLGLAASTLSPAFAHDMKDVDQQFKGQGFSAGMSHDHHYDSSQNMEKMNVHSHAYSDRSDRLKSSQPKTGYVEASYTSFFGDDYVAGTDALTGDDIEWPGPNLGAVSLTVGNQLHPNFAVEAFLGLGAKTGTVIMADVDQTNEFKINAMYGVQLKPSFNLGDKFKLFAKVGYVVGDLDQKVKNMSSNDTLLVLSQDFNEMMYGAGLQFDFNEYLYGAASYAKIHDFGEGFTIGAGVKF